MKFIKIEQEYTVGNGMSDVGLFVYFILLCMRYEHTAENVITINSVGYLAFGRLPTRNEKECIKKGLDELKEKEIITIKTINTNKEYLISFADKEKMYDATIYYDSFDCIDVLPVFKIKTKVNRYKLFKFLILVLRNRWVSRDIEERFKYKVCNIRRDLLAEQADISINSYDKYLKILEENKILYVIRHKGYVVDSTSSGYFKDRNSISLYKDKDICDEFDNKYKRSSSKFKKNQLSNRLASISARYNHFIIKGKVMTTDEITDLYNDCLFYNKIVEKKIVEYEKFGYKNVYKLKDLSVFDGYINEDDINHEDKDTPHKGFEEILNSFSFN